MVSQMESYPRIKEAARQKDQNNLSNVQNSVNSNVGFIYDKCARVMGDIKNETN